MNLTTLYFKIIISKNLGIQKLILPTLFSFLNFVNIWSKRAHKKLAVYKGTTAAEDYII